MRLGLPNGVVGGNLRHTLRALRHRNYRLYFFGQSISLIGTWMHRTAMGWLVYRLTDSPLLLGVAAFANQLPSLILMPWAGVLVDRWPRRRILLATQSLALLPGIALAVLTLSGRVQVWHVLVVAAVLGSLKALDMPARHAFVIEMVPDKEDLASGIALNSSLFNAARMLGPCVAGAIVAVWNEGVCFLVNSISYIAVIGALLAMRVAHTERDDGGTNLWVSLRDGVSYTLQSAPIRTVLMVLSAVSLVGMPYGVLLPVFARDVLGGDARTLGFLVSSSAAGSLVGAIYVASRKGAQGLERLIATGLVVFGLALGALALSPTLAHSMPILACAGFGGMAIFASCNTLIQTVVDDSKRGRVMSLYTVSFMGVMPFGALLAGTLGDHLGAPMAVGIFGVCCLGCAGLYALRVPSMGAALRRVLTAEQGAPATPEGQGSRAGG